MSPHCSKWLWRGDGGVVLLSASVWRGVTGSALVGAGAFSGGERGGRCEADHDRFVITCDGVPASLQGAAGVPVGPRRDDKVVQVAGGVCGVEGMKGAVGGVGVRDDGERMGCEGALDEVTSCGVRHHLSVLGGERFVEVARQAHEVRIIRDCLHPGLDQRFRGFERGVVGEVARS